jgi:hypothetical protein
MQVYKRHEREELVSSHDWGGDHAQAESREDGIRPFSDGAAAQGGGDGTSVSVVLVATAVEDLADTGDDPNKRRKRFYPSRTTVSRPFVLGLLQGGAATGPSGVAVVCLRIHTLPGSAGWGGFSTGTARSMATGDGQQQQSGKASFSSDPFSASSLLRPAAHTAATVYFGLQPRVALAIAKAKALTAAATAVNSLGELNRLHGGVEWPVCLPGDSSTENVASDASDEHQKGTLPASSNKETAGTADESTMPGPQTQKSDWQLVCTGAVK